MNQEISDWSGNSTKVIFQVSNQIFARIFSRSIIATDFSNGLFERGEKTVQAKNIKFCVGDSSQKFLWSLHVNQYNVISIRTFDWDHLGKIWYFSPVQFFILFQTSYYTSRYLSPISRKLWQKSGCSLEKWPYTAHTNFATFLFPPYS